MKNHLVLPGCLLLLWTLTAEKKEATVTVTTVSDGIKLSCGDNSVIINTETNENFTGHLLYSDDETGEYICSSAKTAGEELKIYVKFRTCDNCIELELASMMGIIIGDVVATIGIGVGIYLIAAHAQTGPVQSTSNKKSIYLSIYISIYVYICIYICKLVILKIHKGQKDTYDVIKNKKP
uniref:T-cell surface glycoprotein CD3 gamma chain-like n=1 Tax=Seriola lalandi dorsalis TaxID=1841481 RepID=A0A3B4X595_SERLL